MASGDADETPIGRKEWEKVEANGDSKVVTLTLSSCKVDEFTCDSGACIPLMLVVYCYECLLQPFGDF